MMTALLTFACLAQAPTPPATPAERDSLAQVLHGLLVANAPREVEDRDDWGKTVPPEPGLGLMSLRTKVAVDDKVELPHGSWSRSKVTLADPAKDVQVEVLDLRPADGGKQRLELRVVVRGGWEHERKLWAKGLPLGGVTATGTALVQIDLGAEFTTAVDVTQFPPRLKVSAAVRQTKVELREFAVTKFTNSERVGEVAKRFGDELRPLLQLLVTRKEKDLTQALNDALAKALAK
jgi:hypothetical protein